MIQTMMICFQATSRMRDWVDFNSFPLFKRLTLTNCFGTALLSASGGDMGRYVQYDVAGRFWNHNKRPWNAVFLLPSGKLT
jgi:hypothetical protein